jgi:hypothetical protein
VAPPANTSSNVRIEAHAASATTINGAIALPPRRRVSAIMVSGDAKAVNQVSAASVSHPVMPVSTAMAAAEKCQR